MQTQYSVLGYRIDRCFHDYNLAIEVDEFVRCDRSILNEIQRQKSIEKYFDVPLLEPILMNKILMKENS